MRGSALLRDTLGEHLYPQFLEAAQSQWDSFRQSVSTWELDRYLDV